MDIVMSSYPPPERTVPIFNSDDYNWFGNNITFLTGDERYAKIIRAAYIAENVIEVSSDFPNVGNKRNSISGAITYSASLNPSPTNQVQILVYGTIIESQQLLFPDYVHLSGTQQISARIELDTDLGAGVAFVRAGRQSILEHVYILVNGNADYGLQFGLPTDFGLSGTGRYMSFADARIAHVYATQFNNYFLSSAFFFLGEIYQTQYAVYTNSAFISLQQSATLNNINTTLGRFTIGYYAVNSNIPNAVVALINRCFFRYCETAILLDNSIIDVSNTEVRSNTSGFDITNGSTLKSNNISFVLTGGNQLNVDATSNYFSQACFHTLDSLSIANYDNVAISYLEQDTKNGLGNHYLGESFFIGDRNQPVDTYLGNGLSNPSGEIYLKYDGVTYTDVTTDIEDQTITVTIFDNLTAGNIFYFGDDARFTSSRFDVTQIINVGTGSVVFEYYNGSWVNANYMNAQVNEPYLTYGLNIFNTTELQDIRGDIFLTSSSSDWVQTAINGETKYWARARITGTITQSPTVDYAKLISNTTIITGSGNIKHHGKSRTKKLLPFDITLFEGVAPTKPQNQDNYGSQNIFQGRTFNSFQVGDYSGMNFFLPADFDSSSAVSLIIAFYSSGTGALQANFNMSLAVTVFEEGDQMFKTSGAAPANHKYEQNLTFSMTPNQTNGGFVVFNEFQFYLPQGISSNSSNKPVQMILGTLGRVSDSNSNNMVVVQMALYYISWRTTNIFVN